MIVQTLPVVEGMYPDGFTDEQIEESEAQSVKNLLHDVLDGDVGVIAQVRNERAEVSK